MLINIILLVLVFGARKKKLNPYMAALALGVLKAIIYLAFTMNIVVAIIMGAAFAALASAFSFFLIRVSKRELGGNEGAPIYSTPGTGKVAFRWEYFPLTVILILLIFGEAMISF